MLPELITRGIGDTLRVSLTVPNDRKGEEIAAGQLVALLADFASPPNAIYAVLPQRKHLALRVRLWIDFLKHTWGDPAYWQSAA